MKILMVGSGGREHSLLWKLAQSPQNPLLYAAPGNAGMAQIATCISIGVTEIASLVEFALQERIDLTLVGPEVPLTLGIVDEFESRGLKIFGARRDAAMIEGSKSFAKNLMRKYRIPSGDYEVLDDPKKARAYLEKVGAPIVVKADGLAAGKGAIVCPTLEAAHEAIGMIMEERVFGDAGAQVVIEEYLTGEEASFLAFTDGKTVLPMASSQDHKPIYDNDQGPNTGGMGAYSPAPVVTDAVHQKIMERVMLPAVRGMAAEGHPYKGVLYAGLMIKDGEPRVLEFNARFGDPEAQPLVVRMGSDLIPVLEAVIAERLHEATIEWRSEPTVCVVMASGGYPGQYEKGKVISGLDEAASVPGVVIFHAGTTLKNGKVVTDGGRVLNVTGIGKDIRQAIATAYQGVKKIYWEGVHYRNDIGKKALDRMVG
ncbi:MAG: phosphoribosylamine--glycine ligase [candidate division NC10 bacterium]|jgi:phosphoribosylamine--glycine ligase